MTVDGALRRHRIKRAKWELFLRTAQHNARSESLPGWAYVGGMKDALWAWVGADREAFMALEAAMHAARKEDAS